MNNPDKEVGEGGEEKARKSALPLLQEPREMERLNDI